MRNDPSFRRIVTLYYRDRKGGFLENLQMDSQSLAFESHAEPVSAGAPLPCPRTMSAQPLTAWTLASVVGTLLTALLAVPRALVLAPVLISRSRRA